MTWGAINEWTANAAYNRLAKIADHPTLAELLGRIMRQEGRHAGYYASAARDLLQDRRAQKVTKWFLRHQWEPVGSGDVPRIETAFATAYLFGTRRGTRSSSIGSRSASTPCPGWPTSTWSARRSPRPPAR